MSKAATAIQICMQVLVGEGIHVRSRGKSKGDVISVIVIIIICGKQDYSTSSLRVNLEETEEQAVLPTALLCNPHYAAMIVCDTPIFHPC